MSLIAILLIIVILLLGILIYLVLTRGDIAPEHVEVAINRAMQQTGLEQTIGRLETYARDIRHDYRSLDRMLRVPTARGSLGEIALEQILADQLPPDMFGIRQRLFDGEIPDATIKSTNGIIVIDSKFPLDNYRRWRESKDPKARAQHQRRFLNDVSGHLDKIASTYIRPEKGTTEFAFAFIPAESVYYFLVTHGYDLLREYAHRGVQVVSPLTLAHKIELIRAGVHARRLSEQAEQVRNDIIELSRRFAQVDEAWRVFYGTHFRNAGNKADELDAAYQRLRETFEGIARLG
jgi:DNA recombination protein RmuC